MPAGAASGAAGMEPMEDVAPGTAVPHTELLPFVRQRLTAWHQWEGNTEESENIEELHLTVVISKMLG